MPGNHRPNGKPDLSLWLRLRTVVHRLWRIGRDFERLDNERLAQALDEFAAVRRKREPDQAEPWFETAGELEKSALAHFDAGQMNAAWSALKAADRELIWSFSLEELRLEAVRVAFESESKLTGWRAKTVSAVLAPEWGRLTDAERMRQLVMNELEHEAEEDQLRSRVAGAVAQIASRSCSEQLTELRHRVVVSRRILDEALDNLHRKNDMLRIQVGRSALSASVLLALTSLVLAVQLRANWSPSEVGYLLGDLRSFAVVLVLGAVGASLSGLLTLARSEESSRIPDLRLRWVFLKYRPVIGAISAIVVVAVLQSGVAGLSVTPEAALVAAFVAGFSERLVTRSLDTAASKLGG